MKRYFLDANVVIDYFLNREESNPIHIDILENSKAKELYLSSISVHIIIYTLKLKRNTKAFDLFNVFVSHINIIPLSETIIRQAFLSNYEDFEDLIQYISAIQECNYICTRDIKDFNKINLLFKNKINIL